MFSTYREGVDKQYLSSLHQQPLYTSNYTTNALCARADGVILQEKCQDYLPLIVIWQLRDLWFESDLYLSWAVSSDPSGYWAHTEGCGVSLWLCAHYLLHKCCHLLWSKEYCVYAFSQSVNSSGFSRRSPHRSFLAVQNNFLGWLYAIRCQSKLQPSAEMARKQPKERRGEQTRTMQAWWQRGSRPAKLTAAWLPPATIRQDWKAAKHPFCIASPVLKRAAHEKTSVDWSLYLQKC